MDGQGHVEEDWQTSFPSTSILRVILPMFQEQRKEVSSCCSK